jgi:hypothetical protein
LENHSPSKYKSAHFFANEFVLGYQEACLEKYRELNVLGSLSGSLLSVGVVLIREGRGGNQMTKGLSTTWRKGPV